MSVRHDIRDQSRRFRSGLSGSRFTSFYEQRQRKRGDRWTVGRVVTLALGLVLLVGGLAVGWLPGPGGFVAVFGIALLATESKTLARALDTIEPRIRKAWASVSARWSEGSTSTRVVMAAGVLGVLVGTGWVALEVLT